MSAVAFVSAARAMIGAKWSHRARKDWAVDCIGLVVVALEKVGRPVRDQKRYGREAWGDHLMTACQREFGDPVTDWRSGDIALIRWGNTAHMGVVANHPDSGLSIIHAHNVHGVVEQGLSGPIVKCIVAVYRPFPGGEV